MNIEYIRCGDYYIPNLKLFDDKRPIGKWGRLHRDYLKEYQSHTVQSVSPVRYILNKPCHLPAQQLFQIGGGN